MWLFSTHERSRRPLDVLDSGCFTCSQCGAALPLARYYPVSMSPCLECQAINFVPMRLGDYWLVEPLGGSGLASVYKALRTDDDRTFYAVKILPRQRAGDPALAARLDREARIAAAIGHHPAIANYVASGCVDGEHFLVTEFVAGEHLDERVRRRGRLQATELPLLGLRLLAALAHIHNHGFLYRDLKPENVLMTDPDGAVLFGYGLCLEIEAALRDRGDTIQGSPIFFPPERLAGEGERVSSEVYSLGMVLFYAATGHAYFAQAKARNADWPTLVDPRGNPRDQEVRGLWPSGAELLLRLIARHPDDRPQSFVEVATDLTALLTRRAMALAVAT